MTMWIYKTNTEDNNIGKEQDSVMMLTKYSANEEKYEIVVYQITL